MNQKQQQNRLRTTASEATGELKLTLVAKPLPFILQLLKYKVINTYKYKNAIKVKQPTLSAVNFKMIVIL